MKKKRGVFFSTDAIIAMAIILGVMLIAIPFITETTRKTDLHYDILNSLSSLKIKETSIVPQELITDPNYTILEQIGEFYATGNLQEAKTLADIMLQEVDTKENIGMFYGTPGNYKMITSKNNTSFETAKNIETAKLIISGIKEGESVTGFSARSFLVSGLLNKYFYFGGYVGDGNLSAIIEYSGEISSAEIEVAINEDFTVYINSNEVGTYQKSPSEFIPVRHALPTEHFQSGQNTIEIKGSKLHVAGGLIKITYESDVIYQQPTRYNFPGIEGLINLYDGISIPSDLTSLTASLHLNSTKINTFLTIGNVTVYNSTTVGEQTIILDNSDLLSKGVKHSDLSNKTTPIRLGMENVSYEVTETKIADVFSITDLSGSMRPSCSGSSFWCCAFSGNFCSTQNTCQSCGGTWEDKLTQAKNANKAFVNLVLNYTDNRVGLIGYANSAPNSNFHELSNDNASLKSKIDSWTASGSTCICCGINSGTKNLTEGSSPEKFRSMVVMSDGEANVQCAEQSTGSASNDAIQAACEAWENHNITVNAVAFGEDADIQTMTSIAACGNGSFYFADVSGLEELYKQIAKDLISAAFNEQTIVVGGDLYTRLYPDSYIEFEYEEIPAPFGLIITTENQFINKTTGNFTIPEGSTIIDAKVISYSGPKWTDTLTINNNEFYKLSDYGEQYIQLGDPYNLNIPKGLITDQNNVSLTIALSPSNFSEGSEANKIISTIAREVISFSPIAPMAEGCFWQIQFEDDSILQTNIPGTYLGDNACNYTASGQIYNANDAFQAAVIRLLQQLDLNANNKVDVVFTRQDLQIDLTEVVGIPYTWSTEVQVRTWQ